MTRPRLLRNRDELLGELRVDVPLEQQRRAGVPEVVEGNVWQASTLQKRRQRPLTEVGGVDEAATLTGEYEALVVVESAGPRYASLQ